MKISELISQLEQLKVTHGDVAVMREDFRENTFFSVENALFVTEAANGTTPACVVLGEYDLGDLVELTAQVNASDWSR